MGTINDREKENKANGRKRSSDYMSIFMVTAAGRISKLWPVLFEFPPDWETLAETPCLVCGPGVIEESCCFCPYLYLLTC